MAARSIIPLANRHADRCHRVDKATLFSGATDKALRRDSSIPIQEVTMRLASVFALLAVVVLTACRTSALRKVTR